MTIEEINNINFDNLEYIVTCCSSDIRRMVFLYHHYSFDILYRENNNGIYRIYIMDGHKIGDFIVHNKNYFTTKGFEISTIYEFHQFSILLYSDLINLKNNTTHKYVNEKPSVVFDTYLRKKKIQKLLSI